MKSTPLLSLLARNLPLGLLLVPLVSPPVRAQQAQTSTPSVVEPVRPGTSPARRLDENVTELSPFVVQASQNDMGYSAENTLAGSRINTSLADLASSITVVTRQQMLDTAALDMNDIFLYEANTEGTGNYTAFTFNDQNTVDDGNSRDPAGSNRVRGVGPADRAHNYYQSIASLPFDVYNTDSVEINRGPNALLFGVGSAAGIVNQSSAAADLRRKFAEIGLRYGSNDGYRTSLRFNQPLIPGKLAIFGAALYDSRGFERKPSYDISRRGYGAITYSPFKNTTIRANYERYSGNARRPNQVTPQDGISDWIAAGSPTWDPILFNYTVKGVTTHVTTITAAAAIDGLGQDNQATRPQLYYDKSAGGPEGTPVLWMQGALSNGGVAGTGGFPATLGQLMRSETIEFKQRATTLPLYRTPGITDRSLYDWGSINASSAEVSARRANIYNIDVDQKLTDHLFAQVGWYREEYDTYQGYANGWQMVRIDVNTKLLDGTANPYFGRPFQQAVNTPNNFAYMTNQSFKASLVYTWDARKHDGWMRWFGLNKFFAIGMRNEQETLAMNMLPAVTDAHTWVNPARKVQGTGSIAAGAIIVPRVYLSASGPAITNDPGLIMRTPFDFTLRNAVRVGTTGSVFNWVNEPAHIDQVSAVSSNRSRKKDDSITLGWQGSLLDDRIVPTVGFRRDKNLAQATDALVVDPSTGLVDPTGLDTYGTNSTVFGNTRTAGIVVKPTKWFSVYYNQSRNFTPAGADFDLYHNILPLPTGRGKDYGIRFYLLDNKLTIGLNSYEASADSARGTPATTFVQRTARVEQTFVLWAQALAQARLGSGASTSAIQNEVAKITKLPVGFESPDLTTVDSTSTVKSRGGELQIIYNPVRNWNLKLTAGKQHTTYSNIAPEFDSYSAERLPVWMAATNDSGQLFWTSTVPDSNGGNMVPTTFWTGSVVAPISLSKANEGKRTQGQREWQASVISTYRFMDGSLKGMELGGGIRWQDKAVIGYLGAAADSDGVVRKLDGDKPVFDNPRPSVDLWVSKSFTLPKWFGRNIRAKAQLNVRNAFENGNRLEPVAVNPDGQATVFRIVDPREWYLSTTIYL